MQRFLLPVVLATGACAGRSPPDDTGPGPVAATLTAKNPVVRVEVDVSQVAAAEVVGVDLLSVDNPGRHGLTVCLALATAKVSPAIGCVSPFPVNQGGLFELRVPAPVRQAAQGADAAEIEVSLLPSGSGALDPAVVVELGPLRWGPIGR